jgi:beta-mannanase
LRQTPRHCRPRRSSASPRHLSSGSPTPPRRRLRRLLPVGLTVALLAALTLSAKALAPTAAPSRPGPAGAMLGAYVRPSGSWSGTDERTAVLQLEAKLGRKLAIDHTYVPWGQPPSAWLGRAAWDLSSGRVPLITFGAGGDTREVARGLHDDYLRSVAEGLRSLGKPVLLRYAPAPDVVADQGWVHSGGDYVAAWRHVHQLLAGAPAAWVWAPTASAFAGAHGGVEQYWPGDAYVDWIAADGYNWFGCQPASWRQLGTIFRAFYAWGTGRGKPLMISATASTENAGDAMAKARWFDDALGTLQTAMPNVKAFVYHNSNSGPGCDWRAESTAASLEGFRRLANDPWMQLPPTTAVNPPPGSTTSTTTTTAPPTTTPPSTTRPSTTSPPTTSPPSGGGGLSDLLVPRTGALWGSSSVTPKLEEQVGRKFDIVKLYEDWRSNSPTAGEAALTPARILYVALTSRTFDASPDKCWAEIASGALDADLHRHAANFKAFGRKMFFSFDIEPETRDGACNRSNAIAGSPAQFVAAWRHIKNVFDADGVTNLVYVWNVVGSDASFSYSFYPGDAYVDWIAWDPYNWFTCHNSPWASFGEKVQPFYGWLQQHGLGDKPFMLSEYGSVENPADPTAKGDWFADIPSTLQNRLPNLKAIVYFQGLDGPSNCTFGVDSSAASLAGFARLGQAPYLNSGR